MMPLPNAIADLQPDTEAVETSLDAVATAIVALPGTPTEADLPDIVQIITDINSAAEALRGIVSQILTVLSTTRINQ